MWTIETRKGYGHKTYGSWDEIHTLNENTNVSIQFAETYNLNGFTIKSSFNLFFLLQKIPLLMNERYFDNRIIISSEERAREILEQLKKQAEVIEDYDTITLYLEPDSIQRFENGEIVDGYFDPGRSLVPHDVKLKEMSVAMYANPAGHLLKNGWNEEKEMALYANY